MAMINEDDVVLAFRQSVEEELHRLQVEGGAAEPVYISGDPVADNVARMAQSHAKLQSEVALLRTIILKLISDPVDGNDE